MLQLRSAVRLSALIVSVWMASAASAGEAVPLVAAYDRPSDSSAVWPDAGPLKLDAKLESGAVAVTDPDRGLVAQFDGQNGQGRVNTPGLIGELGHQLTITAWIRPAEFPAKGQAAIVTKRTGGGNKPFSLSIGDNKGLVFEGYDGRGWSSNLWGANGTLRPGVWQHVAVTFKAADRVCLYVNGEVVGEKPVGLPLSPNSDPLVIAWDVAAKNHFKGRLSQVRIYATALDKEQIRAERDGKLTTRPATAADAPPIDYPLDILLVRYDQPKPASGGYGATHMTAARRPGPHAVDWPNLTLDGKPVLRSGELATEFMTLPKRRPPQNMPLLQQPGDHIIEPGNHWFRPVEWRWGRNFVYTGDLTARGWESDYALRAYPILIQPEKGAALGKVSLAYDGKEIYSRNEALESLTLLLPQNASDKRYVLTINGAQSSPFEVGLLPITPGAPVEAVRPLELVVKRSVGLVSVKNGAHSEGFVYQKQWDEDLAQMGQLKQYQAQASKSVAKTGAPLVAHWTGKAGEAKLHDAGELGLDAALVNGAAVVSEGRTGAALRLAGNQTASVPNLPILKDLTRELTFACWIRLDRLPAAGKTAFIVTKRARYEELKPYSLAITGAGELLFEGYDGTWQLNTRSAGGIIRAEQWQHIAFTFRAGDKLRLFLDGKVIAQKKATDSLTPNDKPLIFGFERGWQDNSEYFQGLINEARLFAVALDGTQLVSEMNGKVATKPAEVQRSPLPLIEAAPQFDTMASRIGVVVPRSPVTINAIALPHGMSGGFFYNNMHGATNAFPGTLAEYAAFLAGTGYDRIFEQTQLGGTLGTSGAPRGFDRWALELARHGVGAGLVPGHGWTRPGLQHPNLAFFSWNLPDFAQPLYRDVQLQTQRLGRYGNFAGISIGADNGGYVSFWNWAPVNPDRPWGEAFDAWRGHNLVPVPKSVVDPLAAHERVAKSQKEFVDYIAAFDQTFTRYGYFAQAVREIFPNAVTTSGSFGSSPGVGGRGGWPWASVPGEAIFRDLPVQQAYDWNEQESSKSLHNVALLDRLRSYAPDKPTWALIDDFTLHMDRMSRQVTYALALTRGVRAVGTTFLPNPTGDKARPDVITEQRELFSFIHRLGGAFADARPQATLGILYVHPQALMRKVVAGEQPDDNALLKGSHEGKTNEAMVVAHAAGWPARIITPEELRRGLPAEMKAVLLVGLNRFDDSWVWYDGLEPRLQAFVASGGRILVDDESVSPVQARATAMHMRSYVGNRDRDWTAELVERNRENIDKLRAAMAEVQRPIAWSDDPYQWVIPFRNGDVQYVMAVNVATHPRPKQANLLTILPRVSNMHVQKGATMRTLDGRALNIVNDQASVDFRQDAFAAWVVTPPSTGALSIRFHAASEDLYQATITTTDPGQRGLPVELKLSAGDDHATIFGATGSPISLPLRPSDKMERVTVTATELTTGRKLVTEFAPARQAAGAAQSPRAIDSAVRAFTARSQRALTIGLTEAQAADPAYCAIAQRLAAYFRPHRTSVSVKKVVPGEIVLSPQPFNLVAAYPRWRTEATDLVLLGSATDNLLLFDQARGLLLPDAADMQPARPHACVTHSPFVGEYDALNLLGANIGDVQRVAEHVMMPDGPAVRPSVP